MSNDTFEQGMTLFTRPHKIKRRCDYGLSVVLFDDFLRNIRSAEVCGNALQRGYPLLLAKEGTATDEKLIKLEGTVEEVIYRNAENGYIVLNLDSNGVLVAVNGTLGDIVEGEKLTLHGEYVNSAKYGRQFKAKVCERMLPTTEAEIRKYLGSGIIRGIGPAMAKKIVAAFGTDALYIIEEDPIRLSEIKGITTDKALYIGKEFRRLNSVRAVIEYLQKFAISPAAAILVWKRYGDNSVNLIKENPYLLCESGIDVDFAIADAMAAEMGFDCDNENRTAAGIIYVLRENTYGGHTCLPLKRLCECVCEHLRCDRDMFNQGLRRDIENNAAVLAIIRGYEFVYLTEYYQAEQYITDKLSDMLKIGVHSLKDYSDKIAGIEFAENIKYETLQKAAINGSLGYNLFILTGGPGTGKTTTLNAIIQLCKSMKKSIALAAPTGRAAKRISDLTGEKAKTIHRLLEMDFSDDDTPRFKHNELNPLAADIIIIDEMSMVDALLFEALLRAIKLESKLIMVGDSNQLPSVGAGNILRDLIASKTLPTVELHEIFRQAAQSLIVTNAHSIVNGIMPELNERGKDFFFMNCENEADIPRLVISLAKERLPKTYGYNPIDDIQILTPTKIGLSGTKELNKALQLALNPPMRNKKELKFFDVAFRMGDKVMQVKNDYDVEWKRDGMKGSGIFNGDIGIITDADAFGGTLTIDFDGRIAVYTTDMLQKLDHAFAVTIHKSQGSEYDAVIMPITSVTKNLLYRNLLYTGVTRAKKILIIIGTKQVIAQMVANDRKMLRYSCIKPLLQDKLKKRGEDDEQI